MQIFVSYSRETQPAVKTLVEDLETLGNRVWFDQKLTGGHEWWDEILARIRESDLFIFALSPHSQESYACKLEYTYAADLRKSVLPVVVAEGVSINQLPPALSAKQFVDYRNPDRQAAIRLSKALNSLPPSQPLPDPLPEPPAVPISYLSSLKDQVETPAALSFEEQTALVVKLKERLLDQDTAADARRLLERLRTRDDLYAKVNGLINEALGTATITTHRQTRDSTTEAQPISPPPEPKPPTTGADTMRWLKIGGGVVLGFIGLAILSEALTFGGIGGIVIGIICLAGAYALIRNK